MNKKELSQVYSLNREAEMYRRQIDALEAALQGTKGAATVSGCMPLYPYTRRTIKVEGVIDEEAYSNIKAKIREYQALLRLSQEKCEIEYKRLTREIAEVDDSFMRQILTYRYVSGLSWGQVAACMGGKNTASGVRSAHDRFLQHQSGEGHRK
ncbi:hypothetical protein [Ruthenibacterium lactatiformans]|jgi:hypothetical protein|uniref:hypothetical protein n=1 Tax=Ruthenibacterium lactatiformans TaxID=1550024 RepID=UPI00205F67B2|nr:hypothetical protein [Ruthenibacterium lactatiformans]DAL42758.1 MAG TPA_asm: Protein of unknown function (DUF1492) [Caudoviricetes sp.]